jgi:hypothetical protein
MYGTYLLSVPFAMLFLLFISYPSLYQSAKDAFQNQKCLSLPSSALIQLLNSYRQLSAHQKAAALGFPSFRRQVGSFRRRHVSTPFNKAILTLCLKQCNYSIHHHSERHDNKRKRKRK